MNKPTFNFTQDNLPDGTAAAQFLDDMCTYKNRMIFMPQPRYDAVKKLELYKQYLECEQSENKADAFLIGCAIRIGISKLYSESSPFTEEAATEIFFHTDRFIELYNHLETQPRLDERLTKNTFPFCACPWAKLQFVLAARHFSCNADVLGLFVSCAWKTGNAQSIMTANFGPQFSTALFRSSSVKGLNSFEPAPRKAVKKTLYRGGNMDPRLSHGMAWTEDRDMAVFFAKRFSRKVPVVLSTKTSDNEILARYKHENEVVLPYDPKRPFEVEFV